jgi:DNA modification methylase
MIRHDLPSGTIWEGDWMEAPLQGGYSMAEVDGPFGMKKAAWDRMSIDGLADWYAPHLARLTSLMLPSATVYLWNTAEGWARLDPVMRGLGWGYRSLIVWDKVTSCAAIGWRGTKSWGNRIEVCGVYTRGNPTFIPTLETTENVWQYDATNDGRTEKLYNGVGTDRSNGRYESRVALHPCQKPLLFAERMVQASTRPGDRILVPFGGTCRIATYLERLRRMEPENARYHDTCELNQDGKDYLGAVLGRMGEDTGKAGQMSLFGVR